LYQVQQPRPKERSSTTTGKLLFKGDLAGSHGAGESGGAHPDNVVRGHVVGSIQKPLKTKGIAAFKRKAVRARCADTERHARAEIDSK
jgi:hypothetical protein